MSQVRVRPFQRTDREQVTALVNAHIAAVIPGGSISVNGLLSFLEGESGEYVTNPWVAERVTLVAEQKNRIVATAHLLRYADDPKVGSTYRNVGEILFLVFWPPSTLFPDTEKAARELLAGCAARLHSWRVASVFADGTLPAPGVFGVPEQWPHVRELYREHGFTEPMRTELVLFARVADLERPRSELAAVRTVGICGTRISAVENGATLGFIEVDTNLDSGPRAARFGSWADIGNLHIEKPKRRPELTGWLLGQAADWLELAGATHLLSYANAEFPAEATLLETFGFRLLTSVGRGYTLQQLGGVVGNEANAV